MTDYRIKGEVKAPAKYMDNGETLKDLYRERLELTAILIEHDPRSTGVLSPLLDPYYEDRPRLIKKIPKKLCSGVYRSGLPSIRCYQR